MRIAGWLAVAAVGTVSALVLAGIPGRAHAEPEPDHDDHADHPEHDDPQAEKADQLFAEGRALLGSNLIQACDKFTESLRYNPAAIGALLNVALCDEKLGRVASAFRKFTEARDRAKEQGLREHLRAAEEHIAALEPAIPHLAIRLTEPLPETKLVVDDRLVAAGDSGDVTVDPGERVIVVSAPARLPYRVSLVIARGEHRTIAIPALARSLTITSSRRRIGQLTAAGGAPVLGAGVGFGLYARHLYHKEIDNGNCSQPAGGLTCNPVGKSGTDNARSWGLGGTVVGAAGIAIAAVGAYLWLSAPYSTASDSADKKLAVVPELTGDRVGLAALGRF
jgi:hypothetical protein